MLDQVHRPGEMLQTDGVWPTELGVTLQGEPLAHLLIHSVLPYSNWEWGRVAQSESLNAIRLAAQSTLQQLGAVPRYHQTDKGGAATYRPGAEAETGAGGRAYTEGYLQLLSHYGMEPRTTHRRSPQGNGDVEGSNGGLKRALEQQSQINYRHIITSLLRKPGGFRDYRRREALFPSLVFHYAWEYLNQHHAPRKADLLYLRILYLTAQYLEADVAAALTCLLEASAPWDDTTVADLVQPQLPAAPALAPLTVDLQRYDQLLTEVAYVA